MDLNRAPEPEKEDSTQFVPPIPKATQSIPPGPVTSTEEETRRYGPWMLVTKNSKPGGQKTPPRQDK